MMKVLLWTICLLAVFTTHALADTFEFLTFTPPLGWTKQTTSDGIAYRRPSAIGLISIYSSRPSSGTAEQEFAKMWREKIEAPLSIKGPQPKVETDGIYKVAVGGQTVDAQGTATAISLITVVGNGRVIGVSNVSAGDDALREITAFLNSINFGSSSGPQTPAASNVIELDFNVPAGYVSERDGSRIVIKPKTLDRNTPCVYGISPSRPSKGNLEMDARDAILEPLPGWQVKGDHYNRMRGKSADGWQYLWLRTDVQLPGPSYQYLSAMSMAIESDGDRVAIVWGFGNPAHCLANDIHFARLFQSLRVRGWTSDGGRGLMKELVGTWRNTEAVGMAQYRFLPNGRYEYGQGTSTTFGNLETTTGSVGEGSYAIRNSQLVLTGGRRAGNYLVRVYEEFSAGMWLKTISIINPNSTPPLEVRYMRVRD